MYINWRLFIIGALLTVGLYIVLFSKDTLDPTTGEKRSQKWFGWMLIAIGLCLVVYFHFTGELIFKAQMDGPCGICDQYRQRKDQLRRFDPTEKRLLEVYARGCQQCSNICSDAVRLAEKNPATTVGELRRLKEDCIKTTQSAISAQGDLAKLQGQIAGKGVGAMRITGRDLVFPRVPR